ncbi:hypothetical protein BRADI_1g04191v3 [Brachypodium distachyon]|uniref:Uncharacterized protein n=1 Tax=Brachypodium distachyon TaxID=15368 RepID=A0A0Q3RGY1_BRADI|nr:hypothetical protein BRADI_1g04191v3 [Brachypodium distachyon]
MGVEEAKVTLQGPYVVRPLPIPRLPTKLHRCHRPTALDPASTRSLEYLASHLSPHDEDTASHPDAGAPPPSLPLPPGSAVVPQDDAATPSKSGAGGGGPHRRASHLKKGLPQEPLDGIWKQASLLPPRRSSSRCASSAERPVRFTRPRCFGWPARRTNGVCRHRRAPTARSSSSAAAVFERGVLPHSHVSVPTSLGPPATTARRTLFFQILLLGDMTAPESLKSGASISPRFSLLPDLPLPLPIDRAVGGWSAAGGEGGD